MRINLPDVFLHTTASVPLRFLLAWVAGTLGAVIPSLMGEGMYALDTFAWRLLFFPFHLMVLAVWGGGWTGQWAFVAIPLLLVLGWRLLKYLLDDGHAPQLAWIFWLAFVIALPESGRFWPVAAVLAAIGLAAAIALQRAHPGDGF